MVHKRAAIILAAGKSSRMNSSLSKVLHCVGGQSMLAWSASLARAANVSRAICVVGSDNDDVKDAAKNLGLDIAIQQQQLAGAKERIRGGCEASWINQTTRTRAALTTTITHQTPAHNTHGQ